MSIVIRNKLNQLFNLEKKFSNLHQDNVFEKNL